MHLIRILLPLALILAINACAKPTDDSSLADRAKVLARGAEISGANGLHFGPDGMLYVASVFGGEIVVLDPETGTVLRRIREGVNSPDDIAFLSDGSFYWTAILSGEVAGMRPDGTLVIAAQLTPGTNPITSSPDDRLFVSQCFFDDKLYEVDPQGIEEPRLISDELGPQCGLNGMDWGPDGRLYGPRWFRGEVVSFDVDTHEMRDEAGAFQVPAAVKFDSKGRLHVLDTGAGTVVQLGPDENSRKVVARFEPGLDNLAFDADDRLFVSSFIDGSVDRVNADGSHTRIAPAGLSHPGGLTLREAAGSDGASRSEIVVADMQSIRGFDATTGDPTFVDRNVFGVSEMGSASNISADGTNLILTSTFDGTVKVWDPKTKRVLQVFGGLAAPISAIRYDDRIFVVEHGMGRVIAFGRLLQDRFEVVVSGLRNPTGLVDREGGLYVAEHETGRILKIAQNGSPISTIEVVADGLNAPEGLAATERGFIVVEGETGHIVEVDIDGAMRTIATIPPGAPAASPIVPPSSIFNGVAVGADGSIYATGEAKRVVYRVMAP